jgi:Domain of unknown function (DUF4388)
MGLTGYLSEYSLAEVFQQIQREDLTGLLTIEPEDDSVQSLSSNYYIWFQGGRLVAMAKSLDRTSLLLMLEKRGWITTKTIQNLLSKTEKLEEPLGQYLKSKGVLSTEQLQIIFHAQILQPVCSLFKLTTARFVFNPKTRLAKAEMTGLSVSADEATMLGLRVLRDWSPLSKKLPSIDCGLTKLTTVLPAYKMDMQELQVWELANGKKSIEAIALRLQIDLDIVQQIVFRLKMVGLIAVGSVEIPAPKVETPTAKPENKMMSGWLKPLTQEIVMSDWLKPLKNNKD